jgi:hypothetical protein
MGASLWVSGLDDGQLIGESIPPYKLRMISRAGKSRGQTGLPVVLPKVWLFTTWFFTPFPKEIHPTVQRFVEGVE